MKNRETDTSSKGIEPLPRVAGPAYRPEPRPLKAGALHPVEGRAGAYAYRDVPSVICGQRVPFVSSLVIDTGSKTE